MTDRTEALREEIARIAAPMMEGGREHRPIGSDTPQSRSEALAMRSSQRHQSIRSFVGYTRRRTGTASAYLSVQATSFFSLRAFKAGDA